MGESEMLIRYINHGKGPKHALQTIYLLEGGLFMVSNLLQTHSWVNDESRTHCSVCIQPFLPFRRRHHCRTCGEVVCGGCSSHRTVRLTDINVECETRICTFCIIRATDASIKANEAAFKEKKLEQQSISTVSIQSLASPLERRHEQVEILSADSELWDNEGPPSRTAYEIMNGKGAQEAPIRSATVDSTMKLLVSVVARTLKCPGAFVGITKDSLLCIKASVGMNDHVTHLSEDDCVCLHMSLQNSTVIINDTCADKVLYTEGLDVDRNALRYYAGTPIRVRGHETGVLCAFDTKPHLQTTESMKSTLEAVATIVSQVLEQREAAYRSMNSPAQAKDCTGLSQRPQTDDADLHAPPRGFDLMPSSRHAMAVPASGTTHSSLYADKIAATMDYFHQLQRSAWVELTMLPEVTINESIRTFELLTSKTTFTRCVMKVAATSSTIITELLNYEDAFLYQQLFSQANRRALSGQTWVDCVTLHPNFGTALNESFHTVTHHREYPDGSNVVVASSLFKDKEASEHGLLFGWFVAPSDRHDHQSAVTVSCITAQSFQSQTHALNLSLDLLRRIDQKPAMPRFVQLPSDTATTTKQLILQNEYHSMNRTSHDRVALIHNKDDTSEKKRDRTKQVTTTVNISRNAAYSDGHKPNNCLPECNQTALVSQHESKLLSPLNENEHLLLDLLDKTIHTQEILAQRQHEMAELVITHGTQLERISSALSRVEYILLDNKTTRALKSSTRCADIA